MKINSHKCTFAIPFLCDIIVVLSISIVRFFFFWQKLIEIDVFTLCDWWFLLRYDPICVFVCRWHWLTWAETPNSMSLFNSIEICFKMCLFVCFVSFLNLAIADWTSSRTEHNAYECDASVFQCCHI